MLVRVRGAVEPLFLPHNATRWLDASRHSLPFARWRNRMAGHRTRSIRRLPTPGTLPGKQHPAPQSGASLGLTRVA